MNTNDSICESSLPPNKSSGDIGELKPCPWCGSTASRVRIMSRDAIQCDGENCGVIKRTPDEWNTRTPDPESAAEIERLRRELDAANSNHRSMAHLLAETGIRLEHAESAVAAAWEEAAKIAETVPMGMENHPQKIASAIRAAVSKKTAESGHSPSTYNSESE